MENEMGALRQRRRPLSTLNDVNDGEGVHLKNSGAHSAVSEDTTALQRRELKMNSNDENNDDERSAFSSMMPSTWCCVGRRGRGGDSCKEDFLKRWKSATRHPRRPVILTASSCSYMGITEMAALGGEYPPGAPSGNK